MNDLSLFDIDSQLHDLLTQWQEAPADQLESSQAAIREYVGEVIRSVDPVRRYIRFCDSAETEAREEAQRQAERARMWAARRDRLKAFVLEFMSQWGWKEGKPRKFESPTGSLSLRGNGGLQPLVITDATLVPDELCDVTVTMTLELWAAAAIFFGEDLVGTRVGPRTPSNERIRAALQKPCPSCGGIGAVSGSPRLDRVICSECHGTKTASVPGCRLEPRAETVIVK